jgi:cytochrome c-type biogenesis protein
VKRGQIALLITSIVIIGGGVGVYFLIESLGTKTTIAPDYQLQSLNGTDFTISSLQPKTVLLDFMSIPCIPCKEMNQRMIDLLADPELTGRFTIISIETYTNTSVVDLQNHATSENMTWAVAIAPDGMQADYGVSLIPTFVIINDEGKITYFQEGLIAYDSLKQELIDTIEGRSQGIEITSYQGFIIGFAIITAFSSFFSPCSFPLLPGYVAHILGLDIKKRKEDSEEEVELKSRKGRIMIYPLLGLSSGIGILVSYLILGVVVSSVGSTVLPYVTYFMPIIGGIFIVLGILMFTPIQFSFSRLLGWIRKRQISAEEKSEKSNFSNFSSTFLYGLGYGIASLGCNAPIFLAFSLQVSSQEKAIQMVFAYLAFSITIIALMVGATILISTSRDAFLQKLKASTETIKKISGVIILAVGVYLILEFTVGSLFAIGIALMIVSLAAFTDLIIRLIKKKFELYVGLIEFILGGTFLGLGITLLLRHFLGG